MPDVDGGLRDESGIMLPIEIAENCCEDCKDHPHSTKTP